ncbi:MAG TPA: hypothetical protein VHA70_05715 [Bauldia sp.]|nr:hypothetical protein [Bauldia sp.]
MGTDLVTYGRAQLVGYAGFSGALRGRAKPIAIFAAADILAVALAFGALHVTGAMISGHTPLPQLTSPAAAEAAPVTADISTPLPRIAPLARQALAAMPDSAVMFSQPVGIARAFSFASASEPSSSSFTPPADTTAAAAEPEPAPASPVMPLPRQRPVQQIAQRAADVATPVIDAADGSLDRLLLRDVPSVTTAATGVVGTTLDAATTTVTQVASAAPIQPLAQTVTQPVAQAVQSVSGAVRGLLN